jgi:hypothetical protein
MTKVPDQPPVPIRGSMRAGDGGAATPRMLLNTILKMKKPSEVLGAVRASRRRDRGI